jgi:queuine tRNA-ribosyltransferase
MGFDGYGFGGWPLSRDGKLKSEILALTASLMPADRPKFALGVGSPDEIGECWRMGYDLFDCVLPTRDARHKRLYVLDPDGPKSINIGDEKFARDGRPVSAACDCRLCRDYTRSYLHHLFQIEDSAAWRLATIHNLRTYSEIVRRLSESS